MLTYTHAFILHKIIGEVYNRNLEDRDNELFIGNIFPDYVSYLNPDYHNNSHNLKKLLAFQNPTDFEAGAIIHVLADALSKWNKIPADGDFRKVSPEGFVEKKADEFFQKYKTQLIKYKKYRITKRRFVQSALEYLIRERAYEYLAERLLAAEKFLSENEEMIFEKFSNLYSGVPQYHLRKGIWRYHFVYSEGGAGLSENWKYRLFTLGREILRYENPEFDKAEKTLWHTIDPPKVLKVLEKNPEMVELVLKAADMLRPVWEEKIDRLCKKIVRKNKISNYLQDA